MSDTSGPPESTEPRVNPNHPHSEDELSLFHLLSVLLRRRHSIAGWTVGTAVLVVVFSIVTFQPTFTSEASFTPQAAQRQGGVGGLQAIAGQFGVSVPLDGGSESPEFYSDLLQSREILRRVLDDTFTVNQVRWGDTIRRTGTVLDLMEVEESHEALRRERGLEWLRNSVSTETRIQTGTVTFSVTTPWPNVSAGIAERLLDLVNEFNLQTRQSQAAAERTFTEERLAQAREELRDAEDELRRFLEANRQFQNSPELVFEYDRLQRQVALRQGVVTSLSQSYEQARISEVRNLPVITVVESPEAPVERNPRRLVLRGALGLMLGGMLGVCFALGRGIVNRSREGGDPDYQEFHEVWEDTLNDLRWIRGRSRSASNDDPRVPAGSARAGSDHAGSNHEGS